MIEATPAPNLVSLYKENYYQKTASMSFLEIYDVLQYIQTERQ